MTTCYKWTKVKPGYWQTIESLDGTSDFIAERKYDRAAGGYWWQCRPRFAHHASWFKTLTECKDWADSWGPVWGGKPVLGTVSVMAQQSQASELTLVPSPTLSEVYGVLVDWRDSLPIGHHDLPGAIRACEIFRSEVQ